MHKRITFFFLLHGMAIFNQLTGYLLETIVAGYKISKRLVAYIIQTVYFKSIALEIYICEILIADDM